MVSQPAAQLAYRVVIQAPLCRVSNPWMQLETTALLKAFLIYVSLSPTAAVVELGSQTWFPTTLVGKVDPHVLTIGISCRINNSLTTHFSWH